MSSALKPLTTTTTAASGQVIPAQTAVSKQMHPQTGPGPYSQQIPQNLVNMNPSQAHNLSSHNPNPHQNHYSLNIPSSYQQAPQASSHPVANQSHMTAVSYSPPKSQVYNQSYQMQHSANIPASQSLPATQTPEDGKSHQTNGSADFKPKPSYMLVGANQDNKKDDGKVKVSPEKQPPVEGAKQEAIKQTIEPAEVPQNVSATPMQSIAIATNSPCAPTSTTSNDSSTNVAQAATASSTNTVSQTPGPTIVPPVSSVDLTKSESPSPPPPQQQQQPPPPPTAIAVAAVATASAPIPQQQEQQPAAVVAAEATMVVVDVAKTDSSASNSPTSTATSSGSNTPPASTKLSGTSTPLSASKSEDATPPPAQQKQVDDEQQQQQPSITEKKPAVAQEAQSTTADVPEVVPTKPQKEPTIATSSPTKPTPSPMKLATTPRTPARKTKLAKQQQQQEESPKSSKTSTSTSSASNKSPGGKAKRIRTRTQPYQSPLPELEIISKMTNNSTPKSKNIDEKLIIFYKYEFLAVRNLEGSFYICQAVQNVYKSSPKIRIRWLSQEKGEKSGEIYIPDFYDTTDFDCILTNLNLERVDKSKFRLPPKEKDRTDNILKRAIAVEKGEATSLDDSLTEDNPDGLDVSLYKDEEQLKKRRGTKRKSNTKLDATPTRSSSSKSSPDGSKLRKFSTRTSSSSASKSRTNLRTPPTKRTTSEKKVTTPSSAGRAERAKRRSGQDSSTSSTKTSPVVDHKKAKVLAKVVKRTAVLPSPKPATTPKTTAVVTKSVKQQQQQPAAVASTSKAKQPPTKVVTPPTRRTKRTRK
ncbi:PREDICTED: nucleolar and coiled-body phosphoprotein 1-like [Nicrophorus vespilloides]|uniref:Nucleolar and coiled-body phosphoprotein 1-like n=1 Tax=Nicrophorus vespilloides TaxID=110193 RepID=A0ABM1MRK6_NICVS|nr:PREDICTED: nucleolar and coiled-body phosphoprotein 1-like [Nicrophorus vespilloides]XP_017777206.1 PREDICTED: nucleolar and coiled-body phosphoprotein 1-like [Nicrophorus vespilloides]